MKDLMFNAMLGAIVLGLLVAALGGKLTQRGNIIAGGLLILLAGHSFGQLLSWLAVLL